MGNIFRPPCDEGVILSGAAHPCKESAEPWILTATILGSSMAFIDGTVVNVALPALQANLNATVIDVQWVVESYALLLASLLLVGGSLGDRFGRRLVYAIGIAIFGLASVWCGLAPNVNQLIAARAVQGIGGALLIPGSLAIISASFSAERRGQAIGTWSGFTAITAALGPVLGGWLIEHVSWRWVFFINVPIAAVVLLLIFRQVPETRGQKHQRLDLWGALLATSGLGSVVYGLIESSNLGFTHPMVFFFLLFGAAILGIFFLVESRLRNAMLPLALFRSGDFNGANLLTLLLYAALAGSLFFLPLNLIQVQRYSATAAGAAFLPFTLIMFFLSRWSGGLVKRYGARIPLIIGPLLSALGFALFALPEQAESYWSSFFPAIAVLGFGMAVTVAPLTTTVMNSVEPGQSGIASGINNAVSRTAGLLAVAGFGVILLHNFSQDLDQRMVNIEVSEQAKMAIQSQRIKLAALQLSKDMNPETRRLLREAIDKSFISAFRGIMIISSGLAVASALCAWLMISKKKQPGGKK